MTVGGLWKACSEGDIVEEGGRREVSEGVREKEGAEEERTPHPKAPRTSARWWWSLPIRSMHVIWGTG
jgi:hypothetical protein